MVSCLMGDSTALASAIVRCCLRSMPDPFRVIVEAALSLSVALGLVTIMTPDRIRQMAPIKQSPMPTFISATFEALFSLDFSGASLAS